MTDIDLTKLFNKHFRVEQLPVSIHWNEYLDKDPHINYRKNYNKKEPKINLDSRLDSWLATLTAQPPPAWLEAR